MACNSAENCELFIYLYSNQLFVANNSFGLLKQFSQKSWKMLLNF